MEATLLLAGDVMTGRGVDQILPHPAEPRLVERYVRDARDYVKLVEARSGTIARPVDFAYPWGEALAEIERADARVVNLETSVTRDGRPWPDKEVHYRMHPDNVGCLAAARLDVCALANNHVLDWGHAGLRETLETLHRAGLLTAGAGASRAEAEAPAVLALPGGGRLLVFALGSPTSGVRASWAATDERAGVDFVEHLSAAAAARVAARVHAHKRPGDLVVVSIHWGPNYGWDVPEPFVAFAHALVDGGADVVHGHSSHHPRAVERYRGKLVLYGCGDFLDDYEAIEADDAFRIDLVLAYLATCDVRTGALLRLRMLPLRLRRMRLVRAAPEETRWLLDHVGEASARFDTRVDLAPDGALTL